MAATTRLSVRIDPEASRISTVVSIILVVVAVLQFQDADGAHIGTIVRRRRSHDSDGKQLEHPVQRPCGGSAIRRLREVDQMVNDADIEIEADHLRSKTKLISETLHTRQRIQNTLREYTTINDHWSQYYELIIENPHQSHLVFPYVYTYVVNILTQAALLSLVTKPQVFLMSQFNS